MLFVASSCDGAHTIECGNGHMGLAALQGIHIRSMEINRVVTTNISASDRQISFVQLRARVGASFGHVSRLLTSVADAVRKSATTTAMSTSTATNTPFDRNSSVVDGVVDCVAAAAAIS